MEPTTRGVLTFPGTTDKTNQLAFLSISDGGSNTFIGVNSGNKFPMSNNTFVGFHSGQNTDKATSCVFMGSYAGQNANRVQETVALGWKAGMSLADSDSNTLVGSYAGENLRRSRYNTGVGFKAMSGMYSGLRNTAIGAYAGTTARGMANSVCVGYSSGERATGNLNCFVGAISASNANTYNSTMVGHATGRLLSGNNVVSVGASSIGTTRTASDLTVIGTAAGEYANVLANTVIIGDKAADHMANIANVIVIGSKCGQYMSNTESTVVIGASTGNVVTESRYNTIIGATAAANISANYTTMVGYNSMNRRNQQRVNFSNCVVVGENIGFDLPLTTIEMTLDDTLRLVSTGTSFEDPYHVFQEPYEIYVTDDGAGTGRALWLLDEAGTDFPLTETERDVHLFTSLAVTDGTWSFAWYETVDDYLVPQTKAHECTVSIDGDEITVSLFTDGTLHATKVTTVDASAGTIWLDLDIRQRPSPAGITVSWSFSSMGITHGSTETAVTGPASPVDLTNGFTSTVYSDAPYPNRSIVDITSTATGAGQEKVAYVNILHAARSNTTYVNRTLHTDSSHGVVFNGVVVPDPESYAMDISGAVPALLLNPGDANLYGAYYTLPEPTLSIETFTASYRVPSNGATFGLEWFSTSLSSNVAHGNGYIVECVADDSTLSFEFLSQSTSRVRLTEDAAQTDYRVAVTGPGIPFSTALTQARAAGDMVWVTLGVRHDIATTTTEGIRLAMGIYGYNSNDFEVLNPPQYAAEYVITYTEPFSSIGATGTSPSNYMVYSSASTRGLIAQYVQASLVVARTVPSYTNSIFLGSNFTVDRDISNAFVLNLGPTHTLFQGTANVLQIRSQDVQIHGCLEVGNTSEQNFISFRGLYGDGYEVNVPMTYIGERLYEHGTERSELLLFKGNDITEPLGPERIRLVAPEFRYEAIANVPSNVYAYDTFSKAANANTVPIFVANAEGFTLHGPTRITGNLTVDGNVTYIETRQEISNSVSIVNLGTGPALYVDQQGANPIVDFRDDGNAVVKIFDDGLVFIGNTNSTLLNSNTAPATTALLTVLGNIAAETMVGNIEGTTATFVDHVTTPTLYGNVQGNTATFTTSLTAPTLYGNVEGNTATLTNSVSTPTLYGNVSGNTATLTTSLNTQTLYGNLYGNTATLTNSVSTPTLYGNISGNTATLTTSVITPTLYGNLSGNTAILTTSLTTPTLYGNISGNTATFTTSLNTPTLYGNLYGNTATLTTSVTAPTLYGNLYGNTAILTTSVTTPTLYGNLYGNTATFTNSVSTPTLYGNLYGNTAILTTSVTAPTLYGNVSGNTATFTNSLTTPTLYGNLYGNTATFTNSLTTPTLYGNVSGNTATLTTSLTTPTLYGNVEGTNATLETITITSNAATTLGNAYGYFALGLGGVETGTNVTGGTLDISVSAPYGAIQAAQFIALSDARIKSNIHDVSTKAMVDAVSNIRVRSWTYKDTVQYGAAHRLGFVAQELEHALKPAVFTSNQGQFIPDVYAIAHRDPETGAYVCSDHGLSPNTRVRLVDGRDLIDTSVYTCTSDTLQFHKKLDSDHIFIYGSWATDVKNIDTDAVLSAAICAIHDLQRRVMDLEK